MNWKLIFQLSLFGLAMALATVSVIPSNIESFFWLALFAFCAYVIAKQSRENFFLIGFLVSLANCVWVTSAHIIFVQTYLAHHADQASMLAKMPIPESPRLMMLMTGPIIGIIFGLILGWFAYMASLMVKKQA